MLEAKEEERSSVGMAVPGVAVGDNSMKEGALSCGVRFCGASKEVVGIFNAVVTNWAFVGVKLIKLVLLGVQGQPFMNEFDDEHLVEGGETRKCASMTQPIDIIANGR